MKRYFLTGLVLLLPLALTCVIVLFVFNLLTEPFVGFMNNALQRIGMFPKNGTVLVLISRFLILLLLFFFTLLLGVLARVVLARYVFRIWERALHRIPLIRSIYKTSQDVIKSIFTSSTRSFKQVVLVPFPNAQTQSMGLVTRDDLKDLPEEVGKLIAVFIPTTPNPTSGFLILYPKKDLTYLDMSIEDSLKYVISCGVIASPFVQKGEDK